MILRVMIALTALSLPGCTGKTPRPSTPPALETAAPSHLLEPCPKLPEDIAAGGSRDEDKARDQLRYDGCARKVDGWIAFWGLVQQSVEARR